MSKSRADVRSRKSEVQKKERFCRRCGCTYHKPCVDRLGQSCFWVERDLCSHCLTAAEKRLVQVPLKLKCLADYLGEASSMLLKDSHAARSVIAQLLKGGRR